MILGTAIVPPPPADCVSRYLFTVQWLCLAGLERALRMGFDLALTPLLVCDPSPFHREHLNANAGFQPISWNNRYIIICMEISIWRK